MIFVLAGPAIAVALTQEPQPDSRESQADADRSDTPPESTAPVTTTPGSPPLRQLSAERREAASQAVDLLVWVLLLGGVLIFSTMWTGRRWRRRLRQPPPHPTKNDELWFLKHPPKDEP